MKKNYYFFSVIMSKRSFSGLLLLIIVSVFFGNCDKSDKYLSPETAIEVDENTCVASDATTLRQCIQELISLKKNKLYLSEMIECNDKSCSLEFTNLSNIIIFGSTSSETGIRRTSGYDEFSSLSLRSCSNVTVQDLSFDDMKGSRYKEDYPSTVWVSKSSDTLFKRVTVNGSKGVISIGVSESADFSLIDSVIKDGGAFGLWVKETSGLLVQGCHFKDNRSNAILIDIIFGNLWDDNLIEDSDFEHNHCDAVFNVCDGPCPGGQIDILDASYLTIRNNSIYDGRIDTYPEISGGSAGIELNNGNHMMIEHNTFNNNTGVDLYQNSGNSLSEVYVENNSFDDSLGACTRNVEQLILKNNTCD